MKTHFLKLVFAILVMASCQLAAAQPERATKEEAVAMIKKAVAYIKQNGKEKALAEFSKQEGVFVDRDLYVVALDLNGVMLANKPNPKLVGKQLIDLRDTNGKYFVREQIELAKTQGRGWVEFEWLNPSSKQMEHRSAYLERVDDYFVLSGIFRK